jgi:diguanylate cyclase (GGDEF)-like protein
MATMNHRIARRITLNLVAGILITVVTVLATILWMAGQEDEQAARSTETMVAGGVAAMERRIQALANDYSWWEEAYDAYVREDRDWIEANVGTGITDTYIADFLIILSPVDGNIEYGWIIDEAPDTVESIVTPEVIAVIRKVADTLPIDNLAAIPAFVDTPSVPMMLGIQHLTPVSRAEKVRSSDLPVVVFGQYLSAERLRDLGQTFLIDDLHFVAGAVADGDTLVRDVFGDVLGRFEWTPPTPGRAVLKRVLPPIGIALLLFCVVALTTALRTRRMAIALAKSEREASIAARTDGLTGLMNRTGFTELIDSGKYVRFAEDGELAVIYIDINGFKAVNDSIGHHGGDDLVVALARRLESVLPADAVFARIGGDEFAAVLVGAGASSTAATAANAVVHSLDRPFMVAGFEFHVTVAVGYALATAGADPNEVVRRADLAMYQAKAGAEREAVVYHSTMETGALEKKRVEAALRRGLDNDEITVFYQPVVRASDLALTGLEALVRWNSPELGNVAPSIFVPMAEETGLIHDVGRIVIRQVCRDLARWPGVKVSINISPVQLRDPSFADDLTAILREYGMNPRRIELELTEGILVNNPTIAKRKLAILKELGFTLALDDFGTGFSSIGYLRQFPFDTLKVDRSFVRDIGLNSTANALIQSLVSLGDAMNLSVIAEGVENVDQLNLVRLVQCEYAQGHLISKALPASGVDELFTRLGTERKLTLDPTTGPDAAAASA